MNGEIVNVMHSDSVSLIHNAQYLSKGYKHYQDFHMLLITEAGTSRYEKKMKPIQSGKNCRSSNEAKSESHHVKTPSFYMFTAWYKRVLVPVP